VSRRVRVLLSLVAVPVAATAAFYVLGPGDDSSDAPNRPAQSLSDLAADEAKTRVEDELDEDDEILADLPAGLAAPEKKELANKIVATAVHSTLDWRSTYGSIKDFGDGKGYTAGIIGFCTGTHDLLTLVERYTKENPGNGLAEYLPALRKVDGSDSHEGLDPGFTEAWAAEAEVEAFRKAQETERDRVYFDPSVRLAKLDGLSTLGQFIYYDAMVLHGPGTDEKSFYGLRDEAIDKVGLPAEGADEKKYLQVFLDLSEEAMRTKLTGRDPSRITTAQQRFLDEGNMDLRTPLTWTMYGETFTTK
jgi:chitosanase